MLVIVAPGQGAQTPGFLSPWLELDGAADRLRQWSEVAGLDLVRHGTEASEDEIKDTAVAQPLLVSTPRGKYDRLKATMDLPKSLVAPIAKGQKLGTVKVTLDGKLVAQAPLVATAAVEEGGFFKRLWHELLMWWAD